MTDRFGNNCNFKLFNSNPIEACVPYCCHRCCTPLEDMQSILSIIVFQTLITDLSSCISRRQSYEYVFFIWIIKIENKNVTWEFAKIGFCILNLYLFLFPQSSYKFDVSEISSNTESIDIDFEIKCLGVNLADGTGKASFKVGLENFPYIDG